MWRLFVEQSELCLASISHFGKQITNQIHFGISNHLQYLHPKDVNRFHYLHLLIIVSSSSIDLLLLLNNNIPTNFNFFYNICSTTSIFSLLSTLFFLPHLFFNIVNHFILVGRCHLNFIYPSIWFENLFMSNVDLES